MVNLQNITFLRARHFKVANRKSINWIVLHSAEIGETLQGAEALMQGFARRRINSSGKEIVNSVHFNVDADSITQSVRVEDVAYHAPGANALGIGIELTGRARQTPKEWDDIFSRQTISRAANLTAALCRKWEIPIVFVEVAGLLTGLRGITTHAEVSRAFKKSSHTDPGPGFPIDEFINKIRAYSTLVT